MVRICHIVQSLGQVVKTLFQMPDNEKAPVFIGDINVAAGINQNVLGLADELVIGQKAVALGGRRRNEPGHFLGEARVLDVVDAQAGVKVGQVNQVALYFDVRQVIFEVGIVRAEAAALVAEIGVGNVLGRDRGGED